MDLVLHGMMVSLVTPTAIEFSHWMGVLGCGHPILMSAWRSGTIYLVMVKMPASSDSEVDDMKFLIICTIVRTGPLWRGIGTSSEIMMWDLAWLRACDTLRWAASECPSSIMLLAQ